VSNLAEAGISGRKHLATDRSTTWRSLVRKACQKRGIEPKKEYSGKFNVRVPSRLHADIVSAASADGKSLNQWVVDTLDHAVHL